MGGRCLQCFRPLRLLHCHDDRLVVGMQRIQLPDHASHEQALAMAYGLLGTTPLGACSARRLGRPTVRQADQAVLFGADRLA